MFEDKIARLKPLNEERTVPFAGNFTFEIIFYKKHENGKINLCRGYRFECTGRVLGVNCNEQASVEIFTARCINPGKNIQVQCGGQEIDFAKFLESGKTIKITTDEQTKQNGSWLITGVMRTNGITKPSVPPVQTNAAS